MTTYAIHYAANLARAGKHVEHGIWKKQAGAYNRYGAANPAQCRNRAAMIEFTTDPARVTCDKCAGPDAH